MHATRSAAPDTREWLTTNGLGGYAGGAVCGANTRRYHGLLVAALEPPGRRTVLLSRLDETVEIKGERHELAVSFWASGAIAPRGDTCLTAFTVDPVPTWEYRVGPVRLLKRVVALPGQHAVAIGYRLEDGPSIRLQLKLLANSRDFHGQTRGHPDWRFIQALSERCLEVAAWDGAPRWRLRWTQPADYRAIGEWYWGYHYPEEAARGLPATEDAYCLGALSCTLSAGGSFDLLASVGAEPDESPSLDRIVACVERRRAELLARADLPPTAAAAALVRAADQFVVRRASTNGPTVIAGYHWFGDWGRDTMIALPGLTLTTRRFDDAAGLLRTFARYVDRGMLPNRFPDYPGEPLEYNTVDATLWWFHALDAYLRATGDLGLVREQFPILADVVDWHVRGTRFGIRVDPADGLLRAGQPGWQLTWMDARVDGREVTPRIGKPIEINALWLNAACVMADFADRLGQDSTRYRALVKRARLAMGQFWLPERGYLADVLLDDGTPDPRLRPNQLLAISLPHTAFDRQTALGVLAAVERELLTPFGLRTLAPSHPDFRPIYQGDVPTRDGAYHQGAVWPWLLGPCADALLRVHGPTHETRAGLRDLIRPLLGHLESDGCLGTVAEIFEPLAPHAPVGAVAQAWSVAELLRIYALSR